MTFKWPGLHGCIGFNSGSKLHISMQQGWLSALLLTRTTLGCTLDRSPNERSPWARIIQDCMIFLLVAFYDMQVYSSAILNFVLARGLFNNHSVFALDKTPHVYILGTMD